MQSYERSIQDELKDIRQDIRDLRQEVTKYKGFIGGVMWTVAALVAAFQFVVKWLTNTGA